MSYRLLINRYTEEKNYLIYARDLLRKVIKPSISVVFDERIPTHIKAYLGIIAKPMHLEMISMTSSIMQLGFNI